MPTSNPEPTPDAELHLQTRDGLLVAATARPSSAVLPAFFAGYDRAFVLPNEKETLEGFAECLMLNEGQPYAALSTAYGAFRELVMVAHSPEGDMIGGANFIVYPLASGPSCLNLNYIYVMPEQRRKGRFAPLVRAVRETALAQFPSPLDTAAGQGSPPEQPLIFIEQNDPLRMSPDEYERDTRYTGLDQVARIAIWAKLGARIVDFAYVQPALSESQAADFNLVYSVLGADGASLPACLLRDHLERFFAISVLKGRGLQSSPEAAAQVAEFTALCRRGERVRLLDPTVALQRLGALQPRNFAELGYNSLRALAER